MANEATCRFFLHEKWQGNWEVMFYIFRSDEDKMMSANHGREMTFGVTLLGYVSSRDIASLELLIQSPSSSASVGTLDLPQTQPTRKYADGGLFHDQNLKREFARLCPVVR